MWGFIPTTCKIFVHVHEHALENAYSYGQIDKFVSSYC